MSQKLNEIIINVSNYETRVAILEDYSLVELYYERQINRSVVGNIYLGRVMDILPGMEAAFVDIGLEKNAFLYVEEIIESYKPELEEEQLIQNILSKGQEIMVQIVKEPMGGKGARLTTQVAVPGRYLVLLPFSEFAGVSKKIEEQRREKLKEIVDSIKPKDMGLIVRTAAEKCFKKDLKFDLRYLKKIWKTIIQRKKLSHPPSLIYSELELPLRIVRDVFSEKFQKLIVDDREIFEKITQLLENTNPDLKPRVELYTKDLPIFDKYHLNDDIEKALKRKVWLRSGGYITIDQTEALTAIDVNTGKFIGRNNLEETILQTNLEASEEIVRQLRFRDIGGIIIIDFIDMQEEEHKEQVFQSFNQALETDRTKTRVVEISSLGLIEMTRKKVSDGLLDYLTQTCPRCKGVGRILSNNSNFIEAERIIHKICASNRQPAFLFKGNIEIASMLIGKKASGLNRLQAETGKKIYIYGDNETPPENFMNIKKGSIKEVEYAFQELENQRKNKTIL